MAPKSSLVKAWCPALGGRGSWSRWDLLEGLQVIGVRLEGVCGMSWFLPRPLQLLSHKEKGFT